MTAVLIATVVRGVMLAATAFLLGALAVDVLVLPATAPAPVRRRLRRCSLVAAAVLLLAAPADLWLRTQAMLGQSPGSLAGAVWLVLTRTHVIPIAFHWVLAGWLYALGVVSDAPRTPRAAGR